MLTRPGGLGARRVGGALSLAVCAALLAGCSGGGDDDAPEPTPSSAAGDLTAPGSELTPGDPAEVLFEPDKKHSTKLKVAVTGARRGEIKDLAQFNLSDKDRRSNLVYVRGTVKNTGHGDVGGEWVKLYGKVSDTLVVQPVIFGSTFAKCDYKPLPKPFGFGKRATFCMVMLTPKPGVVSDAEWRFADDQPPITWAIGAHG
jgi:hypothetical protein